MIERKEAFWFNGKAHSSESEAERAEIDYRIAKMMEAIDGQGKFKAAFLAHAQGDLSDPKFCVARALVLFGHTADELPAYKPPSCFVLPTHKPNVVR